MITSFFAHAGVISEAPRVSQILLNALWFLLSLAGIIAIIALVIVALRYLLVQGTDQAAGVKKSLVAIGFGLLAILGGAIVVFTIGRFLS